MKRCTRCKAEKPVAAFSKASRSPDGLHWWCKECFSAHYRATRERTLARNKAWREANPDYMGRYYQEHVEEWSAANRAYRDADRELARRRARQYQKRNLDKFRTYGRARYARKIGAPAVELVDRAAVLQRGSGLCGICTEPVDPTNFHVDHIVPLSAGGAHTYANTQPAHPSCNLRKGARLAA